MINNVAILEAYLWIKSIEGLLSPLQFSRLESLIVSNPVWLKAGANWKKKLLESLSQSAQLKLLGNDFHFANLNDARAMLDEIWIKDIYGLKCSKPLKNVIDAGASSGFFTLVLLTLHQDCKVICVEPNPLNVGLISHNLKKFLSNGQITLIDKALSHNDQGTVLNVPTEVEVFGGMGATTQVRARSVERKSRQVEVGSIELNKLLEKEVCLLKCDIEGAEFDTLIAAGANIRNCKNIIVEIHTDVCDFNEKFMKLLSHLTLNSFQIFCYEGVNNPCSFHEKGISPSFLLFAKNQKMQ